jgi:hypothetical protein
MFAMRDERIVWVKNVSLPFFFKLFFVAIAFWRHKSDVRDLEREGSKMSSTTAM